MGKMFKTSKNKNPMISLEKKNYFKNHKPQIPIGPKISLKMYEKCMKYVNKMKKKG